MTLPKLFATVVGSGVLGVQLWMVVPPFDVEKTWYWPFMNYPMYSRSHDAGDVFKNYELRARPCASGYAPVVLSPELLGIRRFRMYDLLGAIGDADSTSEALREANSSMVLLNHLARTRSPSPLCSLQLRVQSITMEADGVIDPDLSWAPVREWSVDDESPVAAAIASTPSRP